MMQQINVLFAGDTDHPEFRQAIDWMKQNTRLVCCESIASACTLLAAGRFTCDVVVAAEARPGLYSCSDIEKLRRVVPLARIFGLLGSLCEGEMRSGDPWPGVFRSYWHHWPVRFAKAMSDVRQKRCPHWGVAVTSSFDEQVVRQIQPAKKQRGRLVVVHADSDETAVAVSDACRQVDYATIRCVGQNDLQISGAGAVIWDQSQPDFEPMHELRQLIHHYAPAPLLALLSFPRIHTVNQIMAMGARSVVTKPYLLSDLHWELQRIVQQSGSSQRGAA